MESSPFYKSLNNLSTKVQLEEALNPQKSPDKQQYVIEDMLGEGSFAQVWSGIRLATNEKVAIKCCYKTPENKPRFEREAQIWASLGHPNIIQLHEKLEDDEKIIFIMEFMEGDLCKYVERKISLEEEEAKKIFFGILNAVEYCHKNAILHCDIKLENVLLKESGFPKLIDFNLSNWWKPGVVQTEFPGTIHYGSPELLLRRPFGPPSDVWSLGVLLYVMLVGRFPFDKRTPSNEVDVKAVFQQIISRRIEFPPNLSTDAVGLIKKILTLDPEVRPTIPQLKVHPWFQTEDLKNKNVTFDAITNKHLQMLGAGEISPRPGLYKNKSMRLLESPRRSLISPRTPKENDSSLNSPNSSTLSVHSSSSFSSSSSSDLHRSLPSPPSANRLPSKSFSSENRVETKAPLSPPKVKEDSPRIVLTMKHSLATEHHGIDEGVLGSIKFKLKDFISNCVQTVQRTRSSTALITSIRRSNSTAATSSHVASENRPPPSFLHRSPTTINTSTTSNSSSSSAIASSSDPAVLEKQKKRSKTLLSLSLNKEKEKEEKKEKEKEDRRISLLKIAEEKKRGRAKTLS